MQAAGASSRGTLGHGGAGPGRRLPREFGGDIPVPHRRVSVPPAGVLVGAEGMRSGVIPADARAGGASADSAAGPPRWAWPRCSAGRHHPTVHGVVAVQIEKAKVQDAGADRVGSGAERRDPEADCDLSDSDLTRLYS